MNKLIVAVFFAVILAPALAQEQKEIIIPCPEHQIGESYRFKTIDGFNKVRHGRVTITGINGDILEAVNHNGRVEVYDRVFNAIKIGQQEFNPKFYSRPDCPFKLGENRNYKNVKYTGTKGADIVSSFKVTVDSVFTTIVTPLGEYKVVKITSEEKYIWNTGGQSGSGYGNKVSYYAPELGHSVKFEGTDNSGGATDSYSTEIVNYKRGETRNKPK